MYVGQLVHDVDPNSLVYFMYLDYNQPIRLREMRNLISTALAGSIVGCRPLVLGPIGTLVASSVNGNCPLLYMSKIVRSFVVGA